MSSQLFTTPSEIGLFIFSTPLIAAASLPMKNFFLSKPTRLLAYFGRPTKQDIIEEGVSSVLKPDLQKPVPVSIII